MRESNSRRSRNAVVQELKALHDELPGGNRDARWPMPRARTHRGISVFFPASRRFPVCLVADLVRFEYAKRPEEGARVEVRRRYEFHFRHARSSPNVAVGEGVSATLPLSLPPSSDANIVA